MDTRSKIITVFKNIELQKEAITDLQQIKNEKKITDLNPDEDIEFISNNIIEDQKKLKDLQRGYHHDMLSRMVRGGIEDEEMSRWWMNRY